MATKKKTEKSVEKKTRTSQIFSSSVCDIQGNIFLPAQVQKSFLRQNIRQTDSDYDFAPGLRFADEASRSWKIAKASYENFVKQLGKPDLSSEQRLEAVKVFAKQFFETGAFLPLRGDERERTRGTKLSNGFRCLGILSYRPRRSCYQTGSKATTFLRVCGFFQQNSFSVRTGAFKRG